MDTVVELDSDGNDAYSLLLDKEDVDSSLKGMKEVSNLIIVDSSCLDATKSSNLLEVEDVKIGLGSIPLLKSLKR